MELIMPGKNLIPDSNPFNDEELSEKAELPEGLQELDMEMPEDETEEIKNKLVDELEELDND